MQQVRLATEFLTRSPRDVRKLQEELQRLDHSEVVALRQELLEMASQLVNQARLEDENAVLRKELLRLSKAFENPLP